MPFLKKKEAPIAGLTIKMRNPDEKPEQDEDDSSAAIESCAHELIRAIHAKDTRAAAMALKDAFDILESMPHEEEESNIVPNSFKAQNIKAAEEQE